MYLLSIMIMWGQNIKMNNEKIIILKSKQENLEEFKNTLRENQEAFNKEHEELLSSILNTGNEIENIKGDLKLEAEDEYTRTGLKKLSGGIGIRLMTKLEYQEKDAMEWAKENMPIAIIHSIDKKQFETFAKNSELEFVNKVESITVTFPREIKIWNDRPKNNKRIRS